MSTNRKTNRDIADAIQFTVSFHNGAEWKRVNIGFPAVSDASEVLGAMLCVHANMNLMDTAITVLAESMDSIWVGHCGDEESLDKFLAQAFIAN